MKRTIGTRVFAMLAATALLLIGSQICQATNTFYGTVNLNTASSDQLMEIPGIGPAKAKAILEYRSQKPFKTVDEVKEVKGIGDKLFAKISPHLTVSGETRLGSTKSMQPGSGAKARK